MYRVEVELNERYFSSVNPSSGLEYEVVKKNKTTCWVRLWQDGEPTETIYKNIPYKILKKK